MGIIRKIVVGTHGTEIVEAALVVPILFMILLAIFYFGRAYNIYGTITQAAIQGARAAVAPTCATCTNQTLTADQVATQVVGPVLQASHLDNTKVQALSSTACACGSVACGTTVACDPAGLSATPSICVQQNVSITGNGSSTEQCGTAVAFQYPYGFNLPFESFTLQLKATAQMRGEN
jgi:Flp pilus assembly protein TadG